MSVGLASKPLRRSYQGVSAEERQRERRDRLIEAATEVFGVSGYKYATMRDICGKARLSDRYFYESFKNVDEIFEVVYSRMADQLIADVGGAMTTAQPTPEGLVHGGLRAFFQFIRDDPRRAQVMLIDAIHAGQGTPHQEQMAGRGQMFNRVISLISNSFVQNSRGLLNGRLLASGLLGMAIHTAITWAHDGFNASVDDMLDYNLYAWRGLQDWLNTQTPAATDQGAPEPAQRVVQNLLTSFGTTN